MIKGKNHKTDSRDLLYTYFTTSVIRFNFAFALSQIRSQRHSLCFRQTVSQPNLWFHHPKLRYCYHVSPLMETIVSAFNTIHITSPPLKTMLHCFANETSISERLLTSIICVSCFHVHQTIYALILET